MIPRFWDVSPWGTSSVDPEDAIDIGDGHGSRSLSVLFCGGNKI